MRSETKLVKTASRTALAGGGERDRLLDDYQATEAVWLVSNNRLGQASEPPDSSPRRVGRPASESSQTQQLHRRSGQAGSRRPCANVLDAQTLTGLRLKD